MALRFDDRWMWDFWFARDGEDVHLFYLFAPKSLGDPELRHQNARIGHAVSRDLVSWTDLGPALPDAPPGATDDRASWTGCVVRDPDGRWRMFYTGISEAEDGTVQRVISATSPDLMTWERTRLRVPADPRWYEPRDWRDPWVLWDPDAAIWRMYVCARVDRGPEDGRGVIGQLTSADLETWTAGPPVSVPGDFWQLEVPQVVPCGSRVAMLFCSGEEDHSASRLSRGVAREYGTHVLYADGLDGPFLIEHDMFLSGDNGPSMYAGRAIEHEGRWWFLAWDRLDAAGGFVGALSDPFPLDVVDDALVVDFAAPRPSGEAPRAAG
jgi:beta-fructofuranosidase